MASHAPEGRHEAELACELCIIGAGIAGLNALFVARQYLKATDRVILIDRRAAPGGMWNNVYDYSRLHQPHGSFTVGDIPWNWKRPAHYLATGREVQEHLIHCYETLRPAMQLTELFGHTVTACEEVETVAGTAVTITCRNEATPNATTIIRAAKLIKAIGFDVPDAEALPICSAKVISTTPQALSTVLADHPERPVYIVGGGKTGMDTAYSLLTRANPPPVSLINGNGTVFLERDRLFPSGPARWWRGRLMTRLFRDHALLFDGGNVDESFDRLKRTACVSVDEDARQFFLGILSRSERDVIARGLAQVVNDYLVDVVDSPSGPVMLLRSGKRLAVAEGSVIVNCTGNLLRHPHPYEPYLSAGGAILSVTPRSMIGPLTSGAAYFLSHLFFRGELRDAPLYEFDGEAILQRDRRVYHSALMSLSFMNSLVVLQALPYSAFARCGLDLDSLRPFPKRLACFLDLKINGSRYIRHCRRALDHVAETYGVRCGPLAADAVPPSADTSTPPRDSRLSSKRVHSSSVD